MAIGDDRLAATARWLEEQQLDGLVAVNNGQNSFLESNAVFVLSGVRPIGESAIVVDRTGGARLVVTPAWDAARASALSRAGSTVGTDDLAGGIAAALTDHRIDKRRIATVSLGTLGLALVRRIEQAMGGTARAADDYTRDLARVRSADELAAARKATWIAERGYAHMLRTARPGMREFELAAEFYCHMKSLGAEDNFLLVSASQHNLAVCAAGGRTLDAGDVILSEITPCWGGQYAQLCRTTTIGAPAPMLREKYPILKDAMRRGQTAARPGATVRDVARAMDDCFRAAGYGDYCRPPYMRVRGHGLGVTSDRPGDITAASEMRIEEGMVFVMHPNQYLPETGYLMCGEPVVITEAGAEALSARAAELDCVPG